MTDRHPDKQNGMTVRLTLCERDATDRQTGAQFHHNTSHEQQTVAGTGAT